MEDINIKANNEDINIKANNEDSNINSILVFEYYTATGDKDPKIISEAVALTDSLLKDLSYFINSNSFEVTFLVSNDFKDLGIDYGYDDNHKIVFDGRLEKWLDENIAKFDSCIFIAAEENMNLYNLTKLIESKGVKIYGSDSNSTLICSDKFLTFQHLKNTVNQPKTFKFTTDEDTKWELAIKNILESIDSEDNNNNGNNGDNNNNNNFKLIVKPLNGVDCQDIVLISDISDIAKIKDIYPVNSEILVQEFIHGENVSVSLISDGDIAIPISLNKQYLEINKENQRYCGGELPYNHPLKVETFLIAKKAVESIKGLKGFLGVDLIIRDSETYDDLNNINDSIFLLEINSRFTTPYVGLSKIAKFNIGKTIIEKLDGKMFSCGTYKLDDNHVKFIKKGNDLDIEFF